MVGFGQDQEIEREATEHRIHFTKTRGDARYDFSRLYASAVSASLAPCISK